MRFERNIRKLDALHGRSTLLRSSGGWRAAGSDCRSAASSRPLRASRRCRVGIPLSGILPREMTKYGLSVRFCLSGLHLCFRLLQPLLASFVLTGPFGLATSPTIAFAKTALIYWFLMHLNKERGLSRLTRLPRSAGSSSCFSLFCWIMSHAEPALSSQPVRRKGEPRNPSGPCPEERTSRKKGAHGAPSRRIIRRYGSSGPGCGRRSYAARCGWSSTPLTSQASPPCGGCDGSRR